MRVSFITARAAGLPPMGAMAAGETKFLRFFQPVFGLTDRAQRTGQADFAENHRFLRAGRRLRAHDSRAAATARSAAGSVTFMPPATFR